MVKLTKIAIIYSLLLSFLSSSYFYDQNQCLRRAKDLSGIFVPVLITETVDFSRAKGAKVSYFEVSPSDGYTMGLYVDELSKGGGIYANRNTLRIELASENIGRILEADLNLEIEQITGDSGIDQHLLPLGAFNALRGILPSFEEAKSEIVQTQGISDITVMFPGACNVGWNDWFIAGVRNNESGELQLHFPMGENIENKTYGCVVGLTNGEIKILDLRIEQDTTQNKESVGKIYVASDETKKDIKDEIAWFTFGQRVLGGGRVVSAAEVAHEFNDLRHLIDFPFLKYGEDMFWFGLSQMREEVQGNGEKPITEDMLTYKALSGEVLEFSAQSIKDFIGNAAGDLYPDGISSGDLGDILNKAFYKEAEGEDNIQVGQFWATSSDTVKVRYRRGAYPQIAVGVKDDGSVICAFFQGKTAVFGPNVEEVATFMRDHGAIDVVMLGNGGDVSLQLGDELAVPSSEGRERFMGFIYIGVPE